MEYADARATGQRPVYRTPTDRWRSTPSVTSEPARRRCPPISVMRLRTAQPRRRLVADGLVRPTSGPRRSPAAAGRGLVIATDQDHAGIVRCPHRFDIVDAWPWVKQTRARRGRSPSSRQRPALLVAVRWCRRASTSCCGWRVCHHDVDRAARQCRRFVRWQALRQPKAFVYIPTTRLQSTRPDRRGSPSRASPPRNAIFDEFSPRR
jgi:hypothetical protein